MELYIFSSDCIHIVFVHSFMNSLFFCVDGLCRGETV